MMRFVRPAAVMAALLLGACTHTFEVPQSTLAKSAATAERSDAVAALVVTPDLRAAKWSESMMGDTFEAPLGDALIAGAKQLLLDMFSTVEVVPTPGGISKALYYVAPTMLRIEHTQAAWAFGEQVFTMAVEWRVTDRDGQTVLVDTIISEGRGRQGNVFTYKGDTKTTLGRLINDTFAKAEGKLSPVLRHS